MSREWKPSDVAMVETDPYGEMIAFRCGTSSNPGWQYASADGRASSWSADSSGYVRPLRPLVVIDPSSDDEIVALHGALLNHGWRAEADADTSAALREFANPKPPKPEEPTGLGAVVEDVEGDKWILVYDFGYDEKSWAKHGEVGLVGNWREWSDIAAVRVLSEGVQT